MVFVTGDTHNQFARFELRNAKELYLPSKERKYVLICGDCGGIMDEMSACRFINTFRGKPFTLLFIDGNHENFTLLNQYPEVDFMGGKAHKIYENIYHLERGYVFTIDGYRFFCMGGARSVDIQDGILDRADFNSWDELKKKARELDYKFANYRIKGVTWWEEEMPTEQEMQRGLEQLAKCDYKVDFIITHSFPSKICRAWGYTETDRLCDYFDKISEMVECTAWISGHYHSDRPVSATLIKRCGLKSMPYITLYRAILMLNMGQKF